jgi:hypothetical protein
VMIVFFFYGTSFVASNLYIVYWLTHYDEFSNRAAVFLLLACAAIGFWLYIAAGWMGEFISRRKILFWPAVGRSPRLRLCGSTALCGPRWCISWSIS